jgi:excisionase family DNA binding protein
MVHGARELTLTAKGCAMVSAALRLAAKAADLRGVDYRGRDRWDDFSWLLAQCDTVAATAAAPPAASGDAGSVNGARPWRLEVGPSAIWSVAQAAGFLRCSRGAVTAAIRRGQLPATRVGLRAWALLETDVRQHAARNGRRDATADADHDQAGRPAGGRRDQLGPHAALAPGALAGADHGGRPGGRPDDHPAGADAPG